MLNNFQMISCSLQRLETGDRKGKRYAYEQRQRAMSAHAKINVKHPLPHTGKHTPNVHDLELKAQQKTAGG